MKVCVFGAGAIGGYMGVSLARSGAEVSLVARGPHLEAIRAAGLRLQYNGEEHVAHLRCTDNAAELGHQDYVIIGLKAHTIDEAVDAMLPLLGPSTSIVTASNGIPYWYFHGNERLSGVHFRSIDPGGRQWKRLGPERAIGCVVFPAAEVIAPGVIRHEHGRKFPIGEPDGRKSARVELLHEAMVAGGLEAPVRDDIRDEIWLKLCGNMCFNPISALTLATVDIISGDPGTRAICRAMMLEAKAIGDCLGLHLRVDIERRIDGAGALGPHKMSMLQDLERGRSMEVEPLVGVVQELGLFTGIPTPTTDVVLALIRQRAQRAAGALH
ncbi:MAG: 2-dehydropantoate 2-reductase [Pseudomonadota bacterium]|nr:2-dehydropantoate 2-reductase [Pseudomonadota bacterium]